MSCIKRLTVEHVVQYKEELRLMLKFCIESSFSKPLPEDFYDEKLSGLQSYLAQGQACVLGAIKDSCLQGFLWGYPIDTPVGRNFHVAYIAVSPDCRGEGIGTKLLCAAEEWTKEMGLSEVELLVSVENYHAVKLYDKQQYKAHRLIMKKQLDGA